MNNVLDTGLCGCNLHVLHLDYNLLLIKSWIIAIVFHLSVADVVSLSKDHLMNVSKFMY